MNLTGGKAAPYNGALRIVRVNYSGEASSADFALRGKREAYDRRGDWAHGDETHLATKGPQAIKDARLPRTHVHDGRPQGVEAPPAKGACPTDCTTDNSQVGAVVDRR
jgi:hypothetical protein